MIDGQNLTIAAVPAKSELKKSKQGCRAKGVTNREGKNEMPELHSTQRLRATPLPAPNRELGTGAL
ncbi:MAG TPA: hypothetical protein VK968_04730 [Roseimicrobium sp.]|nr:hypothetical protein [Roseimicrobium sp.]